MVPKTVSSEHDIYMTLGESVNFKIVFLDFSNIYCLYTFELPQRGRDKSNMYLQNNMFNGLEVLQHEVLLLIFPQTSQIFFIV